MTNGFVPDILTPHVPRKPGGKVLTVKSAQNLSKNWRKLGIRPFGLPVDGQDRQW